MNIFSLFAATLLTLTTAHFAFGQSEQPVKIDNKSGEKRKICFYNDIVKVDIVATRCFTMAPGESVTWNREGNSSNFRVRIFKSQLVDKYLYSRRLPGRTTLILIGAGSRFGFSEQEAKAAITRYILKVCNRKYDQRVYFSLGFEANKFLVTEGWWSLAKGKCVDLPVSKMLKQNWNVDYGTLPRTFYYARIYGKDPLYWRGGESDHNLCINENRAHKTNQFVVDSAGKYKPFACAGPGLKAVKFRRLDDPKANQQYYYLTF